MAVRDQDLEKIEAVLSDIVEVMDESKCEKSLQLENAGGIMDYIKQNILNFDEETLDEL